MERRRTRKVVKYRYRKHINIGLVIYLIIFAYMTITLIIYMNKKHLVICEVLEASIADDNTFKGIAVRDEDVVKAKGSGYMNYYLRDGERMAKNQLVYSIDESGEVGKQLLGMEGSGNLSTAEMLDIRSDISNFNAMFSDSNYEEVYNFKYNIENAVLESSSTNVTKNLQKVIKEAGLNSDAFTLVKAESSGNISYSIDSMEKLTLDKIDAKTFQDTDYKRKQLRSNERIEKGEPVYKVVKSELWSLVLPLTKEQYTKIESKELSTITVTFIKDEIDAVASISLYQKGDGYYAQLDFDRYMVRYINDRYIEVELHLNAAKGLKIPISSIVKKDFYVIPHSFFTEGGDNGSSGVLIEGLDKDGNVAYEFRQTDIFYQDEEYCYIDTTDIESGTWIHSVDNERYQVKATGKLEGVYNANKGYCVFRRIEKEYENNEYCIVKQDTMYGLSVYDHIVLDGSTAVEQKIIY